MAWVRLDDKFWRNDKMRRLSDAARGVFCDSLSYCADTPEPTGFLTHHEARQRGPLRLIRELEGNGNFEPVEGGFLIHDFDKYLDKGSRDRCRIWRETKRLEGAKRTSPVTSPKGETNVTDLSPRATGLETISTSGFYPNPNPSPEVTGQKPLRRLEMPRRGYRGGDLEPLSLSLPRVGVS